jgi:hypothetical protein
MKNGRKRPWPNLRYHPGMCLEGLSKITIVRTAGLRAEVRTQDVPNTKHHPADSAGTFANHTEKYQKPSLSHQAHLIRGKAFKAEAYLITFKPSARTSKKTSLLHYKDEVVKCRLRA